MRGDPCPGRAGLQGTGRQILAGQHKQFLVPRDVFGERKQMPELIPDTSEVTESEG